VHHCVQLLNNGTYGDRVSIISTFSDGQIVYVAPSIRWWSGSDGKRVALLRQSRSAHHGRYGPRQLNKNNEYSCCYMLAAATLPCRFFLLGRHHVGAVVFFHLGPCSAADAPPGHAPARPPRAPAAAAACAMGVARFPGPRKNINRTRRAGAVWRLQRPRLTLAAVAALNLPTT
jgi:hypothetical protein